MSSVQPRAHHHPSRYRHRPAAITAVALTVTAAIAAVILAAGDVRRQAAPSPGRPPPAALPAPVSAQLALTARGGATRLPSAFLGISTEYWTVSVWAHHLPLLTRVLAMLRADAPLRLRIGGDSADHAFWAPHRELPEWVFELTPSWLTQTGRIVRQAHVRLILDLNLVTSTPQRAAQWARTAEKKLPGGSIRAFEVGNEPDIYSRSSWRHLTAGSGSPPLPTRITAASYARSYAGYARALSRAAPRVALLAPALAEPQKNTSWVRALLQARHPGLTGITAHRYPYSACSHRRTSPTFPTIAHLLSEDATAGMARTALRVEHVSDRARLPLWLTEINSVTCGGTRAVSDTFATALWAPDALLELVRAGVESASVHVRADAINMAFSLTAHGLVPHPLLYGMILFARTVGRGAVLMPSRLTLSAATALKAWIVRLPGKVLHVLFINKGSHRVRVRLNLPVTGTGMVQRLLAVSVRATSGVTLNGQHLGADARWHGTQSTETLPVNRGSAVTVPGYSAALVTLNSR